LLEVCGLFGTLIGDADGIYDPQTYNDRLLLGLKGTMSEAELHILKQRMLEGKRAKARRGELHMLLPRGYVRTPAGEVINGSAAVSAAHGGGAGYRARLRRCTPSSSARA
jgi:DNA invertase Pin-like site-specific DNA recombinase